MNIYEAAKAVKGTRLRAWREADPEVWYADVYGDLSKYGAGSHSLYLILPKLGWLTAEDWRVTTNKERMAFIKELKQRKMKGD